MQVSRAYKHGIAYGNDRMYKILIWLLRHVNIKALYAFASLCVIPISLLASPGARLTYKYYRAKKHLGCFAAIKATYRNHCLFAETVIDKFAVYAGHTFQISKNGVDEYERLLSQPDAVLQLSAHIGCSEILGYSYHTSKPCRVLAFGGENRSLMGYRHKSFNAQNMAMIPVGIDQSHSSEIVEALDRGEVIVAFADRPMNPKKVITSTLHGYKVALAKGPFSIAVTRGLDVIAVNAMKERDGTYSAFFTPLPYDRTAPLSQQRQQLADAYTKEIERLIDMYPMQWFNYFDLWQ